MHRACLHTTLISGAFRPVLFMITYRLLHVPMSVLGWKPLFWACGHSQHSGFISLTIANFQIKTKGNETKSTKMAETAQKFSSNNVLLVNGSNSGFFSHWLSKRNKTCLNVTWLMTFDDISSVCSARSVLCHQLHSYN